MPDTLAFDRTGLANLLDKTCLEEHVRYKVDAKIAKSFGARNFLGYDWNITSKPTYTKEDIEKKLEEIGISTTPEEFVKEKLKVNKDYFNYNHMDFCDDYYFFETLVTSGSEKMYRLAYHRGRRPHSE